MLRSLILSLVLVAPSVFAATANDWRSRSIYQVVTDRFSPSDSSSPTCNTGDRKYCGGTWQGITNHLDYIQNMGFDAVWISPVVANLEDTTGEGQAFHGYWTRDFFSTNAHFGTADDLKALSAALHKRGMYLMLDVVVNHMAADALPPAFGDFSPFNTQTDFHAQCFISDYNNQTNVEQCWLGDTTVPLADINTEDPAIVTTLNSWIGQLVSNFSADAVRIDTVKHIRSDFWPAFATAANVFTIGEVLIDNTTYASTYTKVLDSILDYPTWFPLTAGFSSTSANFSALIDIVTSAQSTYKNGEFMTGSFLENHDQPRFQSITQDQALVKNAMTWPFMQDGIPILYYGQEQGYTGGADPNNREALWLSGYQTQNKPLVTHVTTLNAARKLAISANKDYLATAMKFIPQSTNQTLAILKAPLLTLLTNAGASGSASWKVSANDAGSLFKAGDTLVDVLSCAKTTVDSSGTLSVTASGGMPQVLVPSASLNGQKLCTGSGSKSGAGMVRAPWTLMAGGAAVAVAAALLF